LWVKYYPHGEKEPVIVEPWQVTGNKVVLPRAYGLKLISSHGYDFVDDTSEGYPYDYPYEVTHTGDYAYQGAVVRDIIEHARTEYDFLFSAATGKGKTVMALSAIQKIGKTAFVVVDQINLLEQWVERIQEHLKLPREEIGIVQGNKCEYEGKAIVVCMLQSLVRKKYPLAFYRYAGVVVFDECHVVGAAVFSQCLFLFNAAVRFGVSATIDRKDALQKLIHAHLGEVGPCLTDTHSKSYVYYLESETVYSWYANISPKTGRIHTEVAEDTPRNQLIAEAIHWLYHSGRDVLVLSDRIEQLESLVVMSQGLGLPKEDLGLYCGDYNVWGYRKEPKPKRKPYGYERGTEFTPVSYGATRKKTPQRVREHILGNCRVIFATYGMFAKGLDVPRLSGGIDCTSRARAEQVHGRILRVKEDKLVPLWVTIRDINSYRLDNQFLSRVRQYIASSAEIYEWKIDKGIRAVDFETLQRRVRKNVRELEVCRIETRRDGNYTLETPTTGKG
jgi:superfamily II DNA or RNA helicase